MPYACCTRGGRRVMCVLTCMGLVYQILRVCIRHHKSRTGPRAPWHSREHFDCVCLKTLYASHSKTFLRNGIGKSIYLT